MDERPSRKLAVILHADVVGSTTLVQKNESLAHRRIQDTFRRLSEIIHTHGGTTHELRGDALVAEFDRASDAIRAALVFQAENIELNVTLSDDIRPRVRIGITLGEVLIADNTITGAGVILAQRVEQLADPNGVCVTGAIREAAPMSLPLDYSDLGKCEAKGFEVPVQVYRARLKPGSQFTSPEPEASLHGQSRALQRLWMGVAALLLVSGGGFAWWQSATRKMDPATIEHSQYPLPDKPSIAVLPFTNMSGDPQQEYFTDGITDDLITDLSKISGLFVIARNSAFTYKDKPTNIRQVAQELGVRYVLEGSVRRSGNQVRINAQLIDAATEGHLWADRYDGAITDVFELQDRVTRKIVAALAVTLTPEERAQKASAQTTTPEAYDAFLAGWARYRQSTPEDFAKAIPHFQRAIQLDPDYARAHAAFAAVYVESYWNYWSFWLDIGWVSALEEAAHHLEAAMKEPTPLAHRVAALLHVRRRQIGQAIAEAERAIALDPNDPAGYDAMARILIYSGKPLESLEYVRTAQRLDPESNYLFRIAEAQFQLEEFEEVVTTLRRYSQRNAFDLYPFLYLASAYGHLDRADEARSAFEKCNEMYRNLLRSERRSCRIEDIAILPVSEQMRELLREGLIAAGIGTATPEIIEATSERIVLRKVSPAAPIQDLYDFAQAHCRQFGKKSNLMNSSPPQYWFGCH